MTWCLIGPVSAWYSHLFLFYTLEPEKDSDRTAVIIAVGSLGALVVLIIVILLTVITAIAFMKKGLYNTD